MKWMQDLVAIVGGVMVVGGCWWVYPPAGLIVAGIAAIGFALLWGQSSDS